MKPKKIIIGLVLKLFILCTFAQDNDRMQYLFSGDNDIQASGFWGPFVGFSAIGNDMEVSLGGGGAVLYQDEKGHILYKQYFKAEDFNQLNGHISFLFVWVTN